MDNLSDKYKEIGCAWAPETIYDESKNKLIIYYTMRFGNGQKRTSYFFIFVRKIVHVQIGAFPVYQVI